jgi:hypothetical protein
MAQAVRRRPLTAEAPVCASISPFRICSGRSGTETGFSPSFSVSYYQYHSAVAVHTHLVDEQ